MERLTVETLQATSLHLEPRPRRGLKQARHRRPAAHARARYRCFLPDLAGLAGKRRAGPMPDESILALGFRSDSSPTRTSAPKAPGAGTSLQTTRLASGLLVRCKSHHHQESNNDQPPKHVQLWLFCTSYVDRQDPAKTLLRAVKIRPAMRINIGVLGKGTDSLVALRPRGPECPLHTVMSFLQITKRNTSCFKGL